ncbi:hypothetical protein ACS3UN_08990 [Oscillospiraceae bacterium LTW-04]
MAKIGVLKKHIINYTQTRDVYTDYRKAGYSKKFYEEHRAQLTLHKAAKAAFDELGMKKLPTIKTLQAEYADLLSEKKKAYGQYHATKKEMQDILTAKANIDRLLGLEQEQKEKKNHRNSGKLHCNYISSQRGRSHTIYCVFSKDWGYFPNKQKHTVVTRMPCLPVLPNYFNACLTYLQIQCLLNYNYNINAVT